MNDIEIGESLRALPRASASPGFTSEVLRRIRQERSVQRQPLVWRMAAAVAFAACLIAAVQIGVMHHGQRQRIAKLRSERIKLAAELEAVKKIAQQTQPVVVFENDDGTRVIVDLDSAIQPASHKTFD